MKILKTGQKTGQNSFKIDFFPFLYYFGVVSVYIIEQPSEIMFHYIAEPINDKWWNKTNIANNSGA